MDDPSLDDDSTLRFECPRCGHEERDDYEVLNAEAPADWRCDGCRREFSVLLMECDHCGGETVLVALSASEHPKPVEITCRHCGKLCLADENRTQSDLFA